MADAGEANERLLTQLTFPDANHLPAGAAEGAVDAEVARAVAGEFFVPKGAIGLGLGRMTRTSVPEAAVHEKCEARGAEDEVRSHSEASAFCILNSDFPMPSPPGDLVGA